MLGFYNHLSSEVYDLDKPIGRSFGDVEFYKERLLSNKGKILEPAVGTGRILIPLLESGLHVDGYDSSPEMLRICQNHCQKRGLSPTLFEANMETYLSPTSYQTIIVPTGTFLLLYERESSIRALQNFYHNLENGGKLIVDLFLQTEFTFGTTSTRTWTCDNADVITYQDTLVEVDHINQYSISYGRYEKWRKGTLIETELERFPLRWYGVEEFRLILEKIGFDQIIISADYQFGVYPTKTTKMITFEAIANKA
ncbi:class I SAM-dependent methyltransferase [Brevibacillus laterosporus]|uniref:class I SAM-dependent methyltransferase n=1 Tax=Brevibacillus laterosporus TaxID=1465 RepID=UPI00036661B9|nr:class I SAM-dependent methyltransferase [Brevibacillus laterosporus]ATO51817.1 methyltransferase [Brevibacillus laterosporus DSM 25]AYB37866.1 class I SAM-dependent methyltransferase [Brevibacillus laterosporus]MBG9774830.1 methyltransferase [Brevibacillus laterosporus]MBG9798807.1 methyltransferase [Brevibacillus laterosporus]MBG9802197.1 methyltransferase [Brevibacillus laterosporus]